MTFIEHITLEAADTRAAERFYAEAFGLGDLIRVREAAEPSTGFRGFTLSIIVSQPANVHAFVDAAVAAGATVLKPVSSSLWGVGGSIQAPDGAIWKVATSAKKDTGPAQKKADSVVLLIGADDVKASKRFHVERGLTVGKSFGSYVDFALAGSPIGFGLYKRAALAKDAGVPVAGSGSHRVEIGWDGPAGTDPDGFAWATASVPSGAA